MHFRLDIVKVWNSFCFPKTFLLKIFKLFVSYKNLFNELVEIFKNILLCCAVYSTLLNTYFREFKPHKVLVVQKINMYREESMSIFAMRSDELIIIRFHNFLCNPPRECIRCTVPHLYCILLSGHIN